jgi:hypothetical protein
MPHQQLDEHHGIERGPTARAVKRGEQRLHEAEIDGLEQLLVKVARRHQFQQRGLEGVKAEHTLPTRTPAGS